MAKRKPTHLSLLIGTTKGGFVLDAGRGRRGWKLRGPFHLGQVVNDFRLDPRDGRTLLLSATGGHLGPTLYRSTNRGRTWTESSRPPRFGKATKAKKHAGTSRGQSVRANFWLEPGHADEEGTWYCGTAPFGLFRSTDGGAKWTGVAGFNDHPEWTRWYGFGETQGGAITHSVRVDPRDARHLYVSMSPVGTLESRDRGRTWTAINAGVDAMFLPETEPELGQDPHCMILHPADPDVLYQQNHCGIYRVDRREGDRWTRIGKRMPKRVGDIGFPIVGHPTDPGTVWVFPMDGTRVWPRTSPGGKPAVYRTSDAGRSWQRLDRGFPKEQGWFTVKRQCMDGDGERRSPGLYLGTTAGEVWASRDAGESWECIARHLPHIYSVRTARFA
jgi:photosystem II stability/assembly factor-like uncharacterized protein